ncbi:MAG: hypothetical protein SFU98_01870, partial [Leptospiraceae bacterium]|nr:hypothetical protein [Leptospiraceae bacterium]
QIRISSCISGLIFERNRRIVCAIITQMLSCYDIISGEPNGNISERQGNKTKRVGSFSFLPSFISFSYTRKRKKRYLCM